MRGRIGSMRAKSVWTYRSFLTCFLWNGILVAVLFFAARGVLNGMLLWMDAISPPGGPALPEEASLAFVRLGELVTAVEHRLAPAVIGFGAVVTFFLWLFIVIQGRGLAKRIKAEPALPSPSTEGVQGTRQEAERAPAPEPLYVQPSPQPAIQMLAILQRQGRFVDFLQEDLSLYDDAQIGAAVRSIHQGCKEALSQYVGLKPIFEQAEGVEVDVPPDFDSLSIRLTGNVTGDPPFKGILRHRGWLAVRVELPRPLSERTKDWVVVPAEVEVA
jgi:hypothetical protein